MQREPIKQEQFGRVRASHDFSACVMNALDHLVADADVFFPPRECWRRGPEPLARGVPGFAEFGGEKSVIRPGANLFVAILDGEGEFEERERWAGVDAGLRCRSRYLSDLALVNVIQALPVGLPPYARVRDRDLHWR